MSLITIHQPQYIPWVPYFDKILRSDAFVLLDSVQFQKNGLQNRNQVKSPQGALWLTIPVRQKLDQTIAETPIADPKAAGKHLKTLEMFYKRAPHYAEIYPLMERALGRGHSGLSGLCCELIEEILAYLGYRGRIVKSSELGPEGKASDLVLDICRRMEAKSYLSGKGGAEYLRLADFERAGIQVVFQEYRNQEYPQCFPAIGFVPNLSIIDLLFNTGKGALEIIEKGRL